MMPHSPSRTGAGSIAEAGGADRMATRDTQSLAGAVAGPPNPFQIPANEDLFRLQAEQRAEHQAAKATAAGQSVRDKSTFASRQQALFTDESIKASFQETVRTARKSRAAAAELDASLAAAACAAVPRRVGRENIKELLAKKQEMLLVQMSLDTKRAEIKKLQDRAHQREEALRRSEAILEEDALRFDAFLKENDERVQAAIKHADVQAKAKQDKVLEVKRLNGAIAALRSELSKQQERLEECKRYKDFLDSVTPAEFFAAQAAKQEARRQEQLAAWRADCEALWARRKAAAAAKARAEAEYSNAATQQEAERAERAITAAAATLKEALKLMDPPEPEAKLSSPDEGAGGAAEMFFTRPEQLLQVYADLEESNLFLIQVCQEAEEAAEGVRSQDGDMREQLNSAAAVLQAQISSLQAAFEAAAAKAATLKARAEQGAVAQGRLCLGGGGGAPAAAAAGASSQAGKPDAAAAAAGGPAAAAFEVLSLKDLGRAVASTYQRCGFEPDASLSTLAMLTSIEVRLEECLAAADELPQQQVAEAEKARERERRQLAREQKAAAAAAEHELRVARALERAAAPVFRKTGKPVMARSRPPQHKVVVEFCKEDAEEAELAAFLSTDLL